MTQPLRASRRAFHICPRRGCYREVSNAIFCCPDDWEDLTPRAQALIGETAGLNLLALERRMAINKAMVEWKALDANGKRTQ